MGKFKKCEMLENCQFHATTFKEINESRPYNIRTEYFIVYCVGPLQEICHRAQHMARYQQPPHSNLTPTGLEFTIATETVQPGDQPT
jgi:hypothetical protein